jgi:polyribonucleotide nucleotidyltransferase
MFRTIEKVVDLEDGRKIIIETGKLARQADGSVVVKMGKTMLLATVVTAKEPTEGADFMPLSVEYKEKFASAGRFPGGFMKRESRPGDYEILISRLVDRALRPLFPEDYHAETFVTIFLISADEDTIPDALAGLAASSALAVSDVPFNGPISEVRVARVEGKLVINPSFSQLKNADIDIMVGATMDNILMVEGEMNEVAEADMLEAIRFAHDAIKKQCSVQIELMKEAGTTVKRQYSHEQNNEELRKQVLNKSYEKISEIAAKGLPKQERHNAVDLLKEEILAELVPEDDPEHEAKKVMFDRYFHEAEKKALRNLILEKGLRVDGRRTDEIRPITCETDYLPSTHGSALFTRGETQSLTTVTLGTKLDEKVIDEVLIQGTDKFVLHYNFPPFSTGDAKPMRGLSRREVGHGNLAHRALKKIMPPENENPYAVRVVSDILESNGSSSMATVCAGTLALMDCGIKIRKPVSGIAMGLITDEGLNKYAILSDILGDEDHLGDMDFKVAGTRDGITATQMDIKVAGLNYKILAEALEQARKGRLHILDKMTDVISQPRAEFKPHVPRIIQIVIPKDMIGALIGPGGKVVQGIQNETGATIVIEEIDQKGYVDVFASNQEIIDAAMLKIKAIVTVPEAGTIYKGKVKSIVPFGAFIEILPGREGLLHISEIEWRRIATPDEVLKEGQEVEVKLLEIDNNGKMKLSRKVLLPKPERDPGQPDQNDQHDQKDRYDRGNRHERGNRHDRGDRHERGNRHDRGNR